MRFHLLCPLLVIAATIARNNACEVPSQEEKQALAAIVSGMWNAGEHRTDMNESDAFNNWFVEHCSDDVYVHTITPHGDQIYETRDAVIDPETGLYRAFEPYHSGESIIFTVGGNLEYTCEELDGTEVISVLASVHVATQFEGGQVVADLLVNYEFVYDERWICVKIDWLIQLSEIEELTGAVSMIERVAVLDVMIGYWDALETAINSNDSSILNDWILSNAMEELVMIGPSRGYVWNSRAEAVNETTGVYALGCAPYHHNTVILSMGANIRYSCDTTGAMKVVSLKAPVRFAFRNDEATGSDDALFEFSFVQVAGVWQLKKMEEITHDMQVSQGSLPQEVM